MKLLELQTFLKDPDRIASVAGALAAGKIIIYPTETLYGIGGDPFAPGDPARRVARLKCRPLDQPFIYLVPDVQFLEENIISLSLVTRKLAQRFWPGPLTLIFPVPPVSPLTPIAHEGSIAIRVSPHPFVQALFRHRRFPLISTSANLSGHPAETARDPGKIRKTFRDQIDLFVSEGYKPDTLPSTLLDVRGDTPVVVREGAVKKEELAGFMKKRKERP